MDFKKDDYQLSYVKLDDELPAESSGPSPAPRMRPLSSAEQKLLQTETQGFWGAGWTWEILSAISSVAFLAAIIIVLWHFNGRPMPDWPYGITLNALVSVFSTVMKASMALVVAECLAQLKWSWFRGGNKLSDLALLDAASRGPMGALITLFQTLPRHLITLGCLILVVAAATDPFVQQVMSIKEQPIQSPGHASIQVCNSSLYTDYGEGAGPGMNKLSLGSLGALYSGIFQTQGPGSESAMATCPTGNCTFPKYQSLGVCSSCTNITDLLHPAQLNMGSGYKLSNGLSLVTSYTMPTMMNSTTALHPLRLDVSDKAIITNFTSITSPGMGSSTGLNAAECALYFCVKTYEARVHEGNFFEKTIPIASSTNFSSSLDATLKDFTVTPDTCYYNGTASQTPHVDSENCVYNVNYLSRMAIASSIQPLLKGHGERPVINRPDWSSDTVEAIYGQEGNFTDISTAFESIASSLTVNARSQVCKNSVNGATWAVQSFVHVKWDWLILPAALVGLSIIFLIATMIHTRNQYIWKSSPLALLFSDLLIDDPVPIKSAPTLRDMEDTSRKMEVWLETSASGVRLKAVARS
ncbi:hypothetical protein N7468_005441 [Penicillium chermesinum]|uniref:Uncharacterized protein n=1 Tax=Penicillium chermesinum TaxID=63820 RepID=A0A9W9NZU7_9EURO|nr:uncharacterized protein N7468_005441 [Penicillium chermesinum]KAJ5232485.1 hypothetical protein N7468_005441 [Penicillium chermesinum]